MPYRLNKSSNPLQAFGRGGGGTNNPLGVGINFGNSLLGKGINFLFGKKPSDYVKGHPGSGGQIVGFGVRNLQTIFKPNIDTIQMKAWKYGDERYKDKKHPAGFTPPHAFIQHPEKTYMPWKRYGDKTEIQIEKGHQPFIQIKLGENLGDENIGIQNISNTLEYRKDILKKRDPRTEKFIFGLNTNNKIFEISENFGPISDSDQDSYNGLQAQKNISLQSWNSTLSENEDPTILGFDLEIDEVTSPLFNGSVKTFIEKLSNNNNTYDSLTFSGKITEVESRKEIYEEFIVQFKKFFKMNSATDPLNIVKDYYITKLDGLNKLGHVKSSEKTGEDAGVKLFTDFPNDKITISIREDVNQNISYLSYLYNILSRSRIEGRRIIPQNLLRFNCKITVTEIRNYNRVVKTVSSTKKEDLEGFGVSKKNEFTYFVLSDLISKKEYNFYECEFFFNSLTHGDSIDMGADQKKAVDDFSIDFNYKFVSSEFHRFKFDDTNKISKPPGERFSYDKYNDEYFNPKQLTSRDTDRFIFGSVEPPVIGGVTQSLISFLNPTPEVFTFDAYPKKGFFIDSKEGPLEKLKKNDALKKFARDLTNRLAGDLLRAGANELNRQINNRFALVNKALNERLNKLGVDISLNTIQNPRNIYNPGSNFRNELSNAIRGFVGRSVGRFFSKPLNTAEANNGYLPQRQGGGLGPFSIYPNSRNRKPFGRSTLYNPIVDRNINILRASRLNNPRNVYTPRRVSNFLNTTSPTDPRRNPTRFRTARQNPFTP